MSRVVESAYLKTGKSHVVASSLKQKKPKVYLLDSTRSKTKDKEKLFSPIFQNFLACDSLRVLGSTILVV